MDTQYLQALRYKLQKRFRRLNTARTDFYHHSICHFWQFLSSHSFFVGVMDDLLARVPSAMEDANTIVNEHQALYGETELEAAAVGLHVIRKCVESDQRMPELTISQLYGHESRHDESLKHFTEVFAEPLYEYIDEQIDERGIVLALLRNYKHKCEWFQRGKLFESWSIDTLRGERNLALNLYEYLHDQGVRFFIEPSSVSGEVDLIAAQDSPEPLIADAKIFNPEKGKSTHYLAEAFHQIYTYCVDYNEDVGYLIIFKTSNTGISLALEGEAHGTPFAVLNNKTIFFVVIDIFSHTESASKRGVATVHELTMAQLISVVDAERE